MSDDSLQFPGPDASASEINTWANKHPACKTRADRNLMSALCRLMLENYKETGVFSVKVKHAALAKHCKCDVATIKRRLQRFKDMGVFHWKTDIRVEGGKGSNTYFPGPEPIAQNDSAFSEPIAQTDSAKRERTNSASDSAQIAHVLPSIPSDPNISQNPNIPDLLSEDAKNEFPERPFTDDNKKLAKHWRAVERWYRKWQPDEIRLISQARRNRRNNLKKQSEIDIRGW